MSGVCCRIRHNRRKGRTPMIANAWRGFDFGLGEDTDALRETVARFSGDKIAPRADEIDRSNTFPRDLWPQLGALGVLGVTVAEEYGGAGARHLPHFVALGGGFRGPAALRLPFRGPSQLFLHPNPPHR